ncbi:STAS domain-containing protein [Streptomyces sp. NPDC048507]|uniref:STAS domain-containing protein n=1 Tax=Streptomyces sp. NPDC048507 TaxID=3365560 RepID=UPI00372183C2
MGELPQVVVRVEPDGTAVVVCSGEFDIDTGGTLARACAGDAADAKVLIVDLGLVTFGDSSFLNELLRVRRQRPVILAGPIPAQFRKVLEMTGALALFDVREDPRRA